MKLQIFTIWLLPVVVIGGLFYPVLGYLVLAMMAVLLTLAVFKASRYWCWNLCPRGAFLDIALSKISLNRPIPRILLKKWFRWLVFFLLIAFLILRLIQSGGNPVIIGAIFVSMCIITTVISITLGVMTKHRSWCIICPMGTLQSFIAKRK